MFTIGTAAYKLYSASSQVGTTLSTLSSYHRYVTDAIFNSPSDVENLHPLVKQKLDRLARRIQVLSSPLNYCLLWSQHRGSAVAETIHQSKEVLKQTYHWLHECNKDKSKLSDKEYMVKKLDEHIAEIDFCLQSLNLALSIIQTTDHVLPQSQSSSLSPSSLLTASNRITAMHNAGGDVAICFGQLFKKSVLEHSGWHRIYRRSTLKIYRNGQRRFYELRIEGNEYGADSDDDFGSDRLNESRPLTLRFDLTASLYFTTLSSLIIDLPLKHCSLPNLNLHRLNERDLIQDAFGWVEMMANQVHSQFVFVLKSGLDDWDQPLSSSDDDHQQRPAVASRTNASDALSPRHRASPLRPPNPQNAGPPSDDDHDAVADRETTPPRDALSASAATNQHRVYCPHSDDEHPAGGDHDGFQHLTASLVSLDTAVQQTRRRTHLGELLSPGGDYDSDQLPPQLMAYMTRLAVYENDHTVPQSVDHSNSTFKKYSRSRGAPSSPPMAAPRRRNEDDDDDLAMDSDPPPPPRMGAPPSSGSTVSSPASSSQSGSAFDAIGAEAVAAEVGDPRDGGAKIFPSSHAIKRQQRIPAHLNASDEELFLFLRNPPSPPIPFYPPSVRFAANQFERTGDALSRPGAAAKGRNRDSGSRKRHSASTAAATLCPQKKPRSQRGPPRKSAKSRHGAVAAHRPYFAAPHKAEDVVISYPQSQRDGVRPKRPRQSTKAPAAVVHGNDESLSVSDENHMKCDDVRNELSPKTMKSMAAIKDARNTSLLDHVDLATSQTLSVGDDDDGDGEDRGDGAEDAVLRGNFANLSIDEGD